MTADKRSVFTDALETLGTIVDTQQERDAVHIAVVHIPAPVTLYPGQHVDANGNPSSTEPKVGIVDPYLAGPVYPGQFFWLMIYPRKINSLRHVWSHPAFADEPVKGGGELMKPVTRARAQPQDVAHLRAARIIQEVADMLDVDVDELIEATQEYLDTGKWYRGGETFEGTYIPDSFWDAWETYTGTTVDEDKKYSFLSCSC